MKNQVIVIPYGDNDFWYIMTMVGLIVVQWRENLVNAENFDDDFDMVSFIQKTMKYVLSVEYKSEERQKSLFEHLTRSSAWSRLSGSVPNVYIDTEADEYIKNTYSNGNSEILVIDFRLPKEKQVYIY